MSDIVLGILFLLLIILLHLWYRSLFRGFENVEKMFPGPVPWPILGNALEYWGDGHNAYNAGMRHMKKFRRSFRLWVGPYLYIMVMKPKDVEIVLGSMNTLQKSEMYDYFLPWIGRGLLTAYGNRWQIHRKALTPSFHFSILNGFLDVFNKNAEMLSKKLGEQIKNPSVNAIEYMKLCALDNICETAMGISIDAQNDPNSVYVRSIKKMCEIVFKRTISPWLKPDWILNLTADGKAQKRCLEVIHGFSRDVVQKRIALRAASKKAGVDLDTDEQNNVGAKRRVAFLDLLLNLMDDGILTVQDVMEEVDTFMFEGHDTITAALSYTMYRLGHEPKYQELVYQEQKTLFGSDMRYPTPQDLSDMKYLEMFIKECLRHHPSVSIIGRRAEKDIRLDDYTVIPKGTEVIIPIQGIHMHPDVYENQETFNPDNFLPEVAIKRHPFAYIPFSAGPRNCIGMKFAMMEMKSTISALVRSYKVLPAEHPVPTKTTCEVVVGSKTGFQVRVERRTSDLS